MSILSRTLFPATIEMDVLLARGATYKNLDVGDFLFSEGMSCTFYYQLVEGRIHWQNSNDRGKDFIHEIIEPGESIGTLSLFDDEPYMTDALAVKKSVVLNLHKSAFLQLLAEQPELHFAFSRFLVTRLKQKCYLLKTISLESPEQVVLCMIRKLKKDHGIPDHEIFELPLTRQNLANMTGLRVETVIRAIIHLEKKDMLQIKRGKVLI